MEIPFGRACAPAGSSNLSFACFSSLPTSSFVLFWKVNHPPFLIRGRWLLCALCNGCTAQEKRNNQLRKGCDAVKHVHSLKQFHHRLIFLLYQIICISISCLCVQIQVRSCCRTHRVTLITGSNPFLCGIILRMSFAHSI